MIKSQEIMALVEEVLEYKTISGEKYHKRIVGVIAQLQVFANEYDKWTDYGKTICKWAKAQQLEKDEKIMLGLDEFICAAAIRDQGKE